MKRIFLFALGTLLLASCGSVKHVASTSTGTVDQYRYDIDYVKNVGDGMSMIKVWSYGKTAKIAEEKCKANAVHGVIFKGYTGQGAVQPALVKSAYGYSDNKEFFDIFFSSGDYLRYISSSVGSPVGFGFSCLSACTISANAALQYPHWSAPSREKHSLSFAASSWIASTVVTL